MKRVSYLLLIFLLSIMSQSGSAQNMLHIELDTGSVSPATIALGDTFGVNVRIRNDGPNTNNSPIGFGYSNGTSSSTNSDSTSGVAFNPVTDSIIVGNYTVTRLRVHVSGPFFMAGPSVVVIWPIATGALAKDSLVMQFVVENGVGINEPDDKNIRAFIWNNNLQVVKQGEIQLKRVRIYDILGKEVLNQLNPADRTSLPAMAPGIYLAEITYNNNQRKVFRFYQ